VPRLRSAAAVSSSDTVPVGSGRSLALGVAAGLGADSVMLFLSSLLHWSSCDVVLLVDTPIDASLLQAEGLDLKRVTFEIIPRPLPIPWSGFHSDNARAWLYQDYLTRNHVDTSYALVQLSDVDDVAFQADPFSWLVSSGGDSGVHAFADEPGWVVGSDTRIRESLRNCYGIQEEDKLASQPILTAGYVIGRVGDVMQYVKRVADELAAHQGCERQGLHEAVHNYVLRQSGLGVQLAVHENRRGPVWTGGNVPKGAVQLDRSNDAVITADGSSYIVLHAYTGHEDLWRRMATRFLRNHRERLAVLDCSAFDILPGDMAGFDLDHSPADTQKDCCVACLSDASNCAAFAFSEERRHCWLKIAGGERAPTRPGNDMVCGVKRAGGMNAR